MGEHEAFEAQREAAREVSRAESQLRYVSAITRYLAGVGYAEAHHRSTVEREEPPQPVDEPAPQVDTHIPGSGRRR